MKGVLEMKKIILMIIAICICNIGGFGVNADIINNANISKIKLQSQSPWITEHEKYDYTTTNEAEIQYISNFFELLTTLEGDCPAVTDSKCIYMEYEYSDNTKESYTIYPHGICMHERQTYNITLQEYESFLELIYALKNNKLLLTEPLTFEPSEWAEEYINKAVDYGFLPLWNRVNYTEPITRIEICSIIDNFINKQVSLSENPMRHNPFTDTIDENVQALYSKKIIHGKTENTFCPYEFITREEFAKILSETYKYLTTRELQSETAITFEDNDNISSWAFDYVNKLYCFGILLGYNNEFLPKRNITKEETVLTLVRLYDLVSTEPSP